jgi:hypothetical protein
MAEADQIFGLETIPIKLGEKEFTGSPLTAADLGEFRSWIKKRRIALVLEAYAGRIDQATGLVERILKDSPKVSRENGRAMIEDSVLDEVATEDGMRYILWLSLRKAHKDLKLESLNLPVPVLREATTLIFTSMGGEKEVPLELRPEPEPKSEP